MADLTALLQALLDRRGSDLHLKVGSSPHIRVDGHLEPMGGDGLGPADLDEMVRTVLPPGRAVELEAVGELDFAYSLPGVGRFRMNVHRQRGSFGIVVRRVQPGMPSFDSLGLPLGIRRLAEETHGLVIVSGPPGSGRSTTITMILDHINEHRVANIVTIEDPIEVLHADKRSIVTQREVGPDTRSYAEGMSRVLRHDPDVIFVGELRDPETAMLAVAAAGTGRLVLSTMGTTTAPDTVRQVVDFFPLHEQMQARYSLARCLRAVVSQRLVERADGRGRVPAVETLVATQRVFDIIADPLRSDGTLESAIAEGEYYGMQNFDQSLFHLFRDGLVGLRDALGAATSSEDLRIAIQSAGLHAG